MDKPKMDTPKADVAKVIGAKAAKIKAASDKRHGISKPETKTFYTHGKKYTLPIGKDTDEFLKETFPSEYK